MNAAAPFPRRTRPADQGRAPDALLSLCCSRCTRVLVRKDSLSASPVGGIVLTASPVTVAGRALCMSAANAGHGRRHCGRDVIRRVIVPRTLD
ncbi:hypothetical protein MRX96_039064 [Rhipicephalus microplus]